MDYCEFILLFFLKSLIKNNKDHCKNFGGQLFCDRKLQVLDMAEGEPPHWTCEPEDELLGKEEQGWQASVL